MKSGDDSGKTYKGTLEIPNLSEEHAADEVDITVLTSDGSDNAAALKDFIRLKGVNEIREKLGQYIANLKQGQFAREFRIISFFIHTSAWMILGRRIKAHTLHTLCLQCFDAVGWVAGGASGL